MVNSCCVPLCHTKSMREKELSFHRFPKCELMKKAWVVKIRRDEGESFTVSEHTRVCSLHFTASDYRTTLGGKTVLKDDAVPSVFSWATPVKQRLSRTSSFGLGNVGAKEPCENCQEKDRDISRLETMLQEKDDEIQVLMSNFLTIKRSSESMLFSFKRFDGSDDDIHFYTGFQNSASYKEFMTFVLCHAEDMSYWSLNVHGTLSNSAENTQMSSKSTGYTERALSKMDELFLTLVKLRFGLPLHHVANLFNISSSTVSRVFTSWINLLYFVLRIYQFLVAETCNSRNNARLL